MQKVIEKSLTNELIETVFLIVLSVTVIWALYNVRDLEKQVKKLKTACERSQECRVSLMITESKK